MARSGAHRARGSARRALLVLLLILVVVPVAAFGAYRYATGAEQGPSRPVSFVVPEGATASEVGERLEAAGVIRSALAFRIAAGMRGLEQDLQAGDYELRTNMQIEEVFTVLERGPVVRTVTVTIPEGLELAEVAESVSEDAGVDAKAFEEAATSGDYMLPPYLPDDAESLEGFLFPKTYEFPRPVNEDGIIRRLLEQFEDEVEDLPWDRAEEFGLTPYEVVIVASLIEREARVEQDRTKISAVIHNRLREGMPLQIDATVQYALPEENRELTFDDYEYPSPYNTYLHAGLPPTPIASPGLASLEAALNPADEAYLYFVVTDAETGEHAFAETYEEFLRLKDEAGL